MHLETPYSASHLSVVAIVEAREVLFDHTLSDWVKTVCNVLNGEARYVQEAFLVQWYNTSTFTLELVILSNFYFLENAAAKVYGDLGNEKIYHAYSYVDCHSTAFVLIVTDGRNCHMLRWYLFSKC